jgi:hypothetical protein
MKLQYSCQTTFIQNVEVQIWWKCEPPCKKWCSKWATDHSKIATDDGIWVTMKHVNYICDEKREDVWSFIFLPFTYRIFVVKTKFSLKIERIITVEFYWVFWLVLQSCGLGVYRYLSVICPLTSIVGSFLFEWQWRSVKFQELALFVWKMLLFIHGSDLDSYYSSKTHLRSEALP